MTGLLIYSGDNFTSKDRAGQSARQSPVRRADSRYTPDGLKGFFRRLNPSI